jgi:hypothetical protein
MIKTLLYVIIYPLARELFAFRKMYGETLLRMNSTVKENGPCWIEKGVAKKFSITIMRLPSLGSDDC